MARRRGERDRGKERFWRRVLRQWRDSGRSVRAFCAAHGLSEPSFYGWRRTLAERDREAPAFVPVTVAPAPAAPALEVVLGPDRVVRVPPGFDAATLRDLLAVLAEAAAC